MTHIAPGAAETEFSLVLFRGDKERARQVYQGFKPLRAEEIADVVYYVTSLPGHVNINDIVVMPAAQPNATTILRKNT